MSAVDPGALVTSNRLCAVVARALSFLEKNYGGVVPSMILGPEEKLLIGRLQRELSTYISLLETVKLRDAIRPIFNMSRLGNQLMQSAQPWVLIKSEREEDRVRAGTVIGLCANVICQLSIMLLPYMPASSAQLQAQLNVSGSDVNRLIPELVCRLPAGHKIGKPAPLFQKLEQTLIDDLKKRFSGAQVGAATTTAAAAAATPQPGAGSTSASGDSLESLAQKVAQQVTHIVILTYVLLSSQK